MLGFCFFKDVLVCQSAHTEYMMRVFHAAARYCRFMNALTLFFSEMEWLNSARRKHLTYLFIFAPSYLCRLLTRLKPNLKNSWIFTSRCDVVIAAFRSLWRLSAANSCSLVSYLGLCCIIPRQWSPDRSNLSGAEKRQISIQDQSLIHGGCRPDVWACNMAAGLFHSAVEVIRPQQTTRIYCHLVGCFQLNRSILLKKKNSFVSCPTVWLSFPKSNLSCCSAELSFTHSVSFLKMCNPWLSSHLFAAWVRASSWWRVLLSFCSREAVTKARKHILITNMQVRHYNTHVIHPNWTHELVNLFIRLLIQVSW